MNSQKNILFVSSWYPNRNNPTHGIFNLHFAQAVALNHRVTVLHVCSDPVINEKFELVEKQTGAVFNLTVYYKKVKTSFPILSTWLKRKRRKQAFDLGFNKLQLDKGLPHLIQLNVVLPAGIDVYRLSKKHNIPYVVNEGWTGYMPEDGQYRGLFTKYFTRKIISHAKYILPVSEDLREVMAKNNLSGNFKVIPNVIDTSYFVPLRKEKSLSAHFIHISTLNERQKNVSGLIRAFHKATLLNPNLTLSIVGDGTEKKAQEALVNQLNLNKQIVFRGLLITEQLRKELQNADALIMFSNYESFCVVIAEAWACGIPVIASDAGGLSSEITPELGMLVEKRNEAQLSEAILKMSAEFNKYNAVDLHVFVENHFSQKVIADQLSAIYESAFSKKMAKFNLL